ncbi:MAG: type II secretion system protein N, partial [Woeseiaceae bacterium]
MAITAKWTDFSSLDGMQILATVNRTLPRWVALALVVGIAWQLAKVIWMLVPGSSVGDEIEAPLMQQTPASATSVQQANAQAIAEAHLFGEADRDDAAAAPLPVEAEDLAETRLNLSLKGTVAANDQR